MAPLNVGPTFWNPPPDVIEAGRRARVRYTNGPRAGEIDARYRGLLRTQLPIAPGTQVLRDALAREFNLSQTYMPGRARVMLDTQELDLHQAGRAVDAMTPGDLAKGSEIANHAVRHAESIGIQFVVFAGNRWSGGQPADRRWAAYTGSSPHRDHPHIELTLDGAAMNGGPWWVGRTPPTAAQTETATKGAPAPLNDRDSVIDQYGAYIAGGALLVLGIGGIVLAMRE